jgi:DNA-binding SARP family transcriptional activator
MEAGRSVTILAYLALAPQHRADRDRIAELLWPGAPLHDARHSLRQSLYRLREAADGTELVRSVGGQLLLDNQIRFDCLEGERAADAGDLARAVGLLEGDFRPRSGLRQPGERHRTALSDITDWHGL